LHLFDLNLNKLSKLNNYFDIFLNKIFKIKYYEHIGGLEFLLSPEQVKQFDEII